MEAMAIEPADMSDMKPAPGTREELEERYRERSRIGKIVW